MDTKESNYVISLYIDKNLSICEISKITKISRYHIYNIFEDNSIKLRGKVKFKVVNESIFEKIDTHEKAYFLGLLMADGCNHKGNTILSLHTKDVEILQHLRDFIGYEKEVNIKESVSILHINNKKITSDLENHGFISQKTHFIKFPSIDKEFYNSFILGYLDGDGSISFLKKLNKSNVTITGNGHLIFRLKEILYDINVNCFINKRHKDRDDNILTLNISGNNQIKIFLDWIYKNSKFFLKRKYNKYLELINYLDIKLMKELEKLKSLEDYKKEKFLIMDKKRKDIIDFYNNGLSINQIRKKIGASNKSIREIIINNNIEIRDKRFYEEYRISQYNAIKSNINFSKIGRKIICVESGVIYDNINEAKKINGGNININRSLKTGSKSGGYHWEYFES